MISKSKKGPIRVLVVDDSAFMRKALQKMIESDPGIEVVGTARDGEEGLQKVRHLKPDLVTMDIEMPRMDGLAALREIMRTQPTPVMMVSSLTTDGAEATLDALEMGAVDFIPKSRSYVSLDIVQVHQELLAKIKDIASRKSLLMARWKLRAKPGTAVVDRKPPPVPKPVVPTLIKKAERPPGSKPIRIVAIGSSTGGPPALQQVIASLPRNFPVGVVIAQHMPPAFTASLAERLDSLAAVQVKEAANGDKIEAGTVLIAPGGKQLTVVRHAGLPRAKVSDEPSNTLYKPCVDVLANSVVDQYHGGSLGVMLTGMGNNGVEAFGRIKKEGGVIVAQNEESCVVYGMPRAVVEAGIADQILPIDQVATAIVSYF